MVWHSQFYNLCKAPLRFQEAESQRDCGSSATSALSVLKMKTFINSFTKDILMGKTWIYWILTDASMNSRGVSFLCTGMSCTDLSAADCVVKPFISRMKPGAFTAVFTRIQRDICYRGVGAAGIGWMERRWDAANVERMYSFPHWWMYTSPEAFFAKKKIKIHRAFILYLFPADKFPNMIPL